MARATGRWARGRLLLLAAATALALAGLVAAAMALRLAGPVAAGPRPQLATDPVSTISQVKLSYRTDPSTSIAVTWRDAPTAGGGTLQLTPGTTGLGTRTAGVSTVTAVRRVIAGTDGTPYAYYQADATALKPGTAYAYRVSDGGTASPTYRFTTPVGGTAPLRAAFLGEVHVGDTAQPGWPAPALAPTLQRIQESGAQFMLSTGDNVNTGGVEREWERFFSASPGTFASVPYLTAVGNHETYGGPGTGAPAATFSANFAQPRNGDGSGRYYSYDVNGVHVAVVEANPATPKAYFEAEKAWLARDLAQAAERTRFQVVVDHSPPFHSRTSRVTPTYENPEFREGIVPLMDRYGVELVISGHDKHYVRSFPLRARAASNSVPSIAPKIVGPGRGTTYLELTSTGQNAPDFLQQAWMEKAVPVTAAYLQLDFGATTIEAKAIRPDGSTLDAFTVPQMK